jgi:hypothetical protein
MANQQAPKGAKPGDGPFDDPALVVDAQPTAVFEGAVDATRSIGANQPDAAREQVSTERIAVVPAIPDQPARLPPPGRQARVERLIDEARFARRGRGEAYSQRKTLTLHQYHALCTFPAPGKADVGAPFFAAAKVPSMKAVSHARRPCESSSARNARQIRSQVPSSSQRFNRRQHVAGLGYSFGKSRQRAPVLSTHKIPSMTDRWAIHGRPPCLDRGTRGKCGAIFAHCASVRRTPALAISTSGQCRTAMREKVQVLTTSSGRL